MKSQAVRLFDVFVLGPFMIWFGSRSKKPDDLAKNFLVSSGIGTIIYNWKNYQRIKKETGEGLL